MIKNLATFGRTLGSKDKQTRNKRIIQGARLAVAGSLIGGSLFVNNRMGKANTFLQRVSKPGLTNAAIYDDFTKLPKFSKKMVLGAYKGSEMGGSIPQGSTKKFKSGMRKVYAERTGLQDDWNRIRAAKKQVNTGDIAGQKAFGAKVVQRVRDKATNQGKTFKGIRQDMRNNLGFSQNLIDTNEANFISISPFKNKQERNNTRRNLVAGAILGTGLLAVTGKKLYKKQLNKTINERVNNTIDDAMDKMKTDIKNKFPTPVYKVPDIVGDYNLKKAQEASKQLQNKEAVLQLQSKKDNKSIITQQKATSYKLRQNRRAQNSKKVAQNLDVYKTNQNKLNASPVVKQGRKTYKSVDTANRANSYRQQKMLKPPTTKVRKSFLDMDSLERKRTSDNNIKKLYGFNNSNLFLADFSRTKGSKNRQKRDFKKYAVTGGLIGGAGVLGFDVAENGKYYKVLNSALGTKEGAKIYAPMIAKTIGRGALLGIGVGATAAYLKNKRKQK